MSANKLRLVFNFLLICFALYSCSSVPEYADKEENSMPNKIGKSVEIKQQVSEVTDGHKKNTDSVNIEKENQDDAISIINTKNPNQFNRILKINARSKKSIKDDGIHDANNPGAVLLQNPQEAFSDLPIAKGGNSVDWVKAVELGKIKPRSDLYNPDAVPLVMDLNIIREVKGSMPDVVFPHKQHTEVLDCTNCHPGIFVPQKGANNMSMAKNLMGEMCGVCHGKVAFPLSRCTSCHSQKKAQKEIKQTNWKW
ncbi:MAG: hypothetical protein OEY66_04950 [Gammaproteobacteria bacterium]|nr:hypothetical protein [Gammaproteobacteria bacterium]